MTATIESLEGRERIDPVGTVELLLNQVFLSVFQTEAARSRFGFAHISPQVSFDGLPGWYLWFSDRPGAFLLKGITRCDAPAPRSTLNFETVQGVSLGVFYYPDIEEKDFETFSWPEKIVRCSDYFDQTGTPTEKGRKEIPAPFFLVGQIDFRLSLSRRFLEVESNALERWRDYRMDGFRIQDSSGNPLAVVAAGGLDRDIPGWEITHFLMDKLLLAICFQQRRAPISVRVSKREGFACYLHENRRVEKRAEPEIADMSLAIVLATSMPTEAAVCLREQAAGDNQTREGEPVSGVIGESSAPAEHLRWINPKWWQVKNEPFEPATACGCCHHEH